jgi:phosphatidylserine decarboxylase
MAKDAFYFLVPLLAAAGAALWLEWMAAAGSLAALAAFVAFFFRDPKRTVPAGPGVIASPADGRVVAIEPKGEAIRISIFLSLFNVHINRSPIEGRVDSVVYTKGAFHLAFSEAAGVENERNTLTIAGDGFTVICSQVAGVVARRIICSKKPGDTVARGERIGLIRFGSRVDLEIPLQARMRVALGDRVRGGATTIAVMDEPQ